MVVKLEDKQAHDLIKNGMRAVAEFIRLTALDLLGAIKIRSPKDHGKLQGSWRSKKESNLAYMVYTAVKYALFLHKGTKPHVIRPKTKKALKVSRYGIFKKVNHPGTKPNPFIKQSIDDTAKRVDEFIQIAINSTAGGGVNAT